MKKLINPLIASIVIMLFFHFLGSFAMGGLATVIGVPIPYYNHNYETGEIFLSRWILLLDFIIWFGIIFGISHLAKKKK